MTPHSCVAFLSVLLFQAVLKINLPTQCSIIKWDGLPPQISSAFERTTHKEECAVLLYNAIFVTHARLLRMKTANNDNLHSENDAVHQMINMHRLLTISTSVDWWGDICHCVHAFLLIAVRMLRWLWHSVVRARDHNLCEFQRQQPHYNRSRKLK